MSDTSRVPSTPPPFAISWKIRDALNVIASSYFVTFWLAFSTTAGLAMSLAAQGGAPLDSAWFVTLFGSSPWSECWYVIQGLLTVLFLSVFILRPRQVSWRRFFESAPAVRAAQPAMRAQLVDEVRDAGRLVLIALAVMLALVGGIIALLFLGSHATHHEPARVVASYLQGRKQESELLLRADISWLRILVVVFLAPPLEEILFRGCLYAAMRQRMNAWPANLLSSALFAGIHLYMFNFPNIFVIGVVSAWAYERTRSLRVPMVFHVLWNLVGVVSVKPWLGVALAVVGGLLWIRRPAARAVRVDDRRIGWKLYAGVLLLILVGGYAVDREVAWEAVWDLPLLAAIFFYAWKRPLGSAWIWRIYALTYPVWIALVLWADSMPAAVRAPWQTLLAGGGPDSSPQDIWIEVIGTLALTIPGWLVVSRFARWPFTSAREMVSEEAASS